MRLSINPADLLKVNFLLAGVKNGAPTVLARAVNKALDGGSPEVKAVVMATTNIKSTTIGEQVKATERATAQHIKGKVVIGEGVYGKGLGVALIDYYNVRETKKGVTYQVAKGKPRLLLAGGFKATMKSGHTGVFLRAGSTNLTYGRGVKDTLRGTVKPVDQRKEAISEVFRTSVVDASGDQLPAVVEKMQGRLDNELDRQLNLLLDKL